MKRVAIAAALLAAIMICSAASALIIRAENRELAAVTEEISEYSRAGDAKKAAEAAERFTELWKRFERKMSVFVRDDKLGELSASAAKVPAYIAAANDELDAELESIRRRLDLIYRSELPTWYNIL